MVCARIWDRLGHVRVAHAWQTEGTACTHHHGRGAAAQTLAAGAGRSVCMPCAPWALTLPTGTQPRALSERKARAHDCDGGAPKVRASQQHPRAALPHAQQACCCWRLPGKCLWQVKRWVKTVLQSRVTPPPRPGCDAARPCPGRGSQPSALSAPSRPAPLSRNAAGLCGVARASNERVDATARVAAGLCCA